ncbi:MAG: radical SAM protein, partial [Candidatus Omnitrophica bacterium]|nr:radical SAM protein [Candidatus Omnitrophota bacterium]
LCALGLSRVHFTGGEPFIRADIVDLVNYAKNKNLIVGVNSNGTLMPDDIGKLRHLDFLSLSMEGPEEIHNRIRGNGSYSKLIKMAQAAQRVGIKLRFMATINKYNWQNIEQVLKLVADFKTKIAFQILHPLFLGSDIKHELIIKKNDLRKTIAILIEYKTNSTYRNVIANSFAGLRYLSDWPELYPLKCAFGQIAFRITPDGVMFSCAYSTFDNCSASKYSINILKKTPAQIKKSLSAFNKFNCRCNCACSSIIEANLFWNFKIRSIPDILNLLTF